jgi:hypothetical protein
MLLHMRIGTWNLDGRWTDEPAKFLEWQDCDVWLLTEVSTDVHLHGYQWVVTKDPMTKDRYWSAILSRRGLEKRVDPHPATAAAIVDGTMYWSSVLPWRTCGDQQPWDGSTHADKVAAVLRALEPARPAGPLIWGGDWNQSLVGRDYAGSTEGRQHLLALIDRLSLHVPTAGLCHQLPDHASIDHIALPQDYLAHRVEHLTAKHLEASLSDHDAYVIDIDSRG